MGKEVQINFGSRQIAIAPDDRSDKLRMTIRLGELEVDSFKRAYRRASALMAENNFNPEDLSESPTTEGILREVWSKEGYDLEILVSSDQSPQESVSFVLNKIQEELDRMQSGVHLGKVKK